MHADRVIQAILKLDYDKSQVSILTSFVENAASCYGLEPADALDLTLASEEIFVYLCSQANQTEQLEIRCRHGGYFVQLQFDFHAGNFDLSAFNLTALQAIDITSDQPETGLLIASRLVDKFSFFKHDGFSQLILRKEKSYPVDHIGPLPPAKAMRDFLVREPEPEELKLLVHYLHYRYESCVIPMSFQSPGKVADMVRYGACKAVIAADKLGSIGGGIFWAWQNAKLVEFWGPYSFGEPENSAVSSRLVEYMISSIARTTVVGLITIAPSPQLPLEYFEPLGTLNMIAPEGTVCKTTCYYRHMHEDSGSSVWASQLVKDFLTREYEKHVFARKIRIVANEGENISQTSVIATDIDKGQAKATLKPIWWGKDDLKLIQAYVKTLLKEGLFNILFEMDLGHSWECYFTPALMESHFEPCLVLPYGGTGDMLMFQYSGGNII
ncbi:MAG: ATP-binding protein [Deltaproteobacteria bacterium]|nr:ATP-binding protein [Deltaproteobacteria bacterium]